MAHDVVLEEIARVAASHPENIAISSFDEEYFNALTPPLQKRLLDCIRSGIENPDSEMGCYANQALDYDDLEGFFRKVVGRYHGVDGQSVHRSDWTLKREESGKILDFRQFGLPPLSTRIRVGRNLEGFPLPAAMEPEDRLRLEERMIEVFAELQGHHAYVGTYHSLTPDHPNEIDATEYQVLVDRHLMFKDMTGDRFLASAGVASDWPVGRGCYISRDAGFIVWVGEEDHLRIMIMETATDLAVVFEKLRTAVDLIESNEAVDFAHSEKFGYITSCPTNLGTAMRASVHLPLPKLMDKVGLEGVSKIARSLQLSVRGVGGEHTGAGEDGTVDLSPRARFCVTEVEIVRQLYKGIRAISQQEAEAG